ncbi:STAS domain-containing protein [Streptomyces sp. NPDC051940]|uniref:STAS domain-containing protein n=1 Tax=Streptomyces sp. NPDC051940 TaxID=3155675 RepID=UPI003441269F
MTLRMDESERNGWLVLRVHGEMDLLTSPALRHRLHEAVAQGRRDVVVDLAGVRVCDSSGVGVLIAVRRQIRSCGGRLRLVLPDGREPAESQVNRVLSALGVRRLFEVYGELGEALDDLGEPLPA